ncbi:hypothetical protein L6164_016927 [Bauhinia variegata]|uniref:Uncharacterized protein n=1 Tax=Bauhinia variegata TaxID=167791 RepID=A0ACB9N875_BAUVA|nr:hypothetical protein L6164_016927 [Bauhinia variegata]
MLHAYGFPDQFISLLSHCFQIVSSILVNGCKTDPFLSKCGLRQGDPLSPYLFILAINHLSIFIQEELDNKK